MKYLIVALFLMTVPLLGVTAQKTETRENDKLMVVWSSGDRDVALKVCFMYTNAAKRNDWFDVVHLIVWGPSAKLLTEDKELQEKLKMMQDNGVVVEACISCANMYGVADKLKKLDIDVKGMGTPLTERLKADWKQLNF
ncbi:DsrE family protein [Carboxylicivirga sp. M1479]|uniref:DsrE family protein n=1 Tax=Carboxylicivirga sp. M1479 TaxID=2594476 RepID=UPI0021061738|nr:DsrE family protein [Carboxylicivirga sp. M1479]